MSVPTQKLFKLTWCMTQMKKTRNAIFFFFWQQPLQATAVRSDLFGIVSLVAEKCVRPRLVHGYLAAALLLGGCGGTPPAAQVSGHVTYEGKPVPAAVVLFENSSQGVFMTARVVDGDYKLVTAGNAGIPPGSYRVAISPPVVDHPLGPILEPPKKSTDPLIPDRYHDVETSQLVVELVDGVNSVELDMTKR